MSAKASKYTLKCLFGSERLSGCELFLLSTSFCALMAACGVLIQ